MKLRILIFLLLACLPAVYAQPFEHIWHTPSDTSEVPGGVSMRDPVFPGVEASATFYQGVWKGEGANQTGGTFLYRFDGGAWQSEALDFHADAGANQFWKATVTMPASANAQMEYYFLVTFSNRNDTYLHAGQDGFNAKTLDENTAREDSYAFIVGPSSSSGNASLSVNGLNANYNTLNYYIDEISDSSFPQLFLEFTPGVPGVTGVEIFTNLNNRDRANLDYNNDGIEDGIIPPDGNIITAADTGAYFQAHPMADAGGGIYTLSLPANKTGAYRLTARFKTSGDQSSLHEELRWRTSESRR